MINVVEFLFIEENLVDLLFKKLYFGVVVVLVAPFQEYFFYYCAEGEVEIFAFLDLLGLVY